MREFNVPRESMIVVGGSTFKFSWRKEPEFNKNGYMLEENAIENRKVYIFSSNREEIAELIQARDNGDIRWFEVR